MIRESGEIGTSRHGEDGQGEWITEGSSVSVCGTERVDADWNMLVVIRCHLQRHRTRAFLGGCPDNSRSGKSSRIM